MESRVYRECDNSSLVPVILGMVVIALWSLFVCFIGYYGGTESFKREAVLKGFAEYKPDESGKSVWQWKSTPE